MEGGGRNEAIASGPNAVAGLFCFWDGPPGDPRGHIKLTYLLYESKKAMLADYGGMTYAGGPAGSASGETCSTVWKEPLPSLDARVAEHPYLRNGKKAGRVFCEATKFAPAITWTDDGRLVLARAVQSGAMGPPSTLHSWWLEALSEDI
jgi:hypothetical protein